MKYPNRPTIYLTPIKYRRPWYRWNWWVVALIVLPIAFTVFIVWCAAKAVHP